jgi:hypothetical protein
VNVHYWTIALGVTLVMTGCADDDDSGSSVAAESTETQQTTSGPQPTTTTVDPRSEWGPPAPNGRQRPAPPGDAAEAAATIERTESALRSPDTAFARLGDLGHRNQVAYRTAAAHPRWANKIRASLRPDLVSVFDSHMAIRTSLGTLLAEPPTHVPPWRIIEPEPIETLLGYYTEAEAATGIEWEYLAAINLIETGMGRIDGLSTAGAQGPMQFIPTTWDEVGEGDVDNPRDAIAAAARYLVVRRGPADMDAALWGYNNSDHYVEAVKAYAMLLADNPAALNVLYNWEIYFSTPEGSLWLPVGMINPDTTEAADFMITNPWSAPLG